LNGNTDDENNFELMKELFADLSKGNGVVILSASKGNQLAEESDTWHSGAFTYCLKLGLRSGEADLDKNGHITVDELKGYVIRKVWEITHGKQESTVRKDLSDTDWVIW
jgi:uncharacterized caspase-like protein